MKKITNLIFILAAVVLLSFPLGVIIRITPFENVNIYPQDVLVGLTSLTIIICYLRDIINKYKKLFFSILAFNLIAVISLLVSSGALTGFELLVSFSYLVRFDAYISLLFIGIVAFSKYQHKLLEKLFIFVTFAFVVLGFFQYFFYNDLRNLYYLGWDEHLNRLFSTLLDPNFTGLILAMFSVFLIGNYVLHKKLNQRNSFFFVASLLVLVALVLTYSRTAIISLILGLGLLLFSLRKIKVLVFSILAILIGIIFVSDFSAEGTNPLRTASVEARFENMQEGFVIFLENPIIGVGFNAYRYTQIDKGFASHDPKFVSNAGAGTDNSFLFILATTGIIGFAAYLAIWYQIINTIKKLKSHREKITSYSMILILFIGGQFINALFYAPIMMWIFFYLGFFVMEKSSTQSGK